MPKNLVYIGIAALAIVAVVLGFKIYQQKTNLIPLIDQQPNGSRQPILQQDQSQSTTLQNTASQQASAAEIEAVLKFPGPNATDAERKKHSDLVNKLGNQSGAAYLDISACKPTPVVYRVRQGASFRIKNSDNVDHNIYADPQKQTAIKADSELTVTSSSVGNNLGDYGYNCDGSTNPVGIIQVVP